MVETEAVSVETVLRCSRANKGEILAALIREKMAEYHNWLPFAIRDGNDKTIGAFYPDRTSFERAESPPSMTAEERARFEEAMRHPERSFTLEEFMREEYPEDFRPRS